MGDAAQKAANRVKPSEEALAQINRPADDNIWHEAPSFSHDNLKNQIKSTFKPVSGQDAHDAARDADGVAYPSGSRDSTDVAKRAAEDQRYGTASSVNVQSGINSDTEEKTRVARERTLNYISQKMPQGSRERTIWRLKKMVIEIQGHPDCKFPY